MLPRIYCFWTGHNEITPNRKTALESLKQNSGVEIVLVTPKNLSEYIVPGFPLHKTYDFLSLVHKSDYLRCYFMHHHGGGYMDVKHCRHSWVEAFRVFNSSPLKSILGYREVGKRGVAQCQDAVIQSELDKFWHLLVGNSAYICRPYTAFTTDWFHELNQRLDVHFNELIKHPGNIYGDNEGYPVKWTEILGQIFHPLCLKYNNDILFYDKICPVFKNYR